MRHAALLVTSVLAALNSSPASATNGVCDGIVPPSPVAGGAKRPLTAADLIRLRDIGYSHLAPGQTLLALSPDRRSVAFSMFRADPENNGYCEAIFVVDRKSGALRKLAQSTELILEAYPIRGVRVDYGAPKTIVPLWSPDGHWLAYLKRENGSTQIWRVALAGGPDEQLTREPVNVDRFAWTSDGKSIVFETRPGLLDAEHDIDLEGRRGFLFDDRVVPYSGSRPLVRLPLPIRTWRFDLEKRRTIEAQDTDKKALPPAVPFDPTQAMRSATSASGRRLWTARRDPDAHLSPIDLWGEDVRGAKHRCNDPSCTATPYSPIEQLWWSVDGRSALFLRREGWANSRTALYRWVPGSPRTERVLSTDDLLVGCEISENRLICAREQSSAPRHLVEIDVRAGTERLLFEPNPEFKSVELGSVERLHWASADGTEAFGDLVLPPSRNRGPLPLIIVQYTSRGFLRGGIGDETPIQLFAAHGYAVLSFNAPVVMPKWDGSKKSFTETVALSNRNWAERRTKFAALDAGIQVLVDRGTVDPRRIGITGPSDGAATARFGIINKPGYFAAASVSSCCEEPTSYMLYGGIGLAKERIDWGYPPARGAGSEAWAPVSLAMNSDKMKTPLLMQLADHEYLIALDSFMSLRSAKTPVEMEIFPGEFHLKWQPAHREAAYRRNLQWFDFWMLGKEDPDPVDPDQYARWKEMRVARPQ